MIFVDRSSVSRPRFLDSPDVRKVYQLAEDFFDLPASKRGQRRFPFDAKLLAHPELRDALSELFHNKCSFCESVMTWTIPENVNRYRPIYQTIELDGTIFPDHYWWLMFDWDNLIPLCTECVRACGTRFPILGPRASYGARGDELLAEQPLLLDPCRDRPDEHLVYTPDGLVVSSTRPGQVTIEVFNLNRSALVDARQKVYKRYEQVKNQLMILIEKGARPGNPQAEELLDTLRHAGDADEPYAGMMRQFLNTWMPSFRSFAEQTTRLEESRQTGDRAAEAQSLLEVGMSSADTRDYERAAAAFQEALTIAEDMDDAETEMLALLGLGGVFGQQKDYPKAIQSLEKAMDIAAEAGSAVYEGAAAANLAQALVGAGGLADAESVYRRALDLAGKTGDRNIELTALSGLGNLSMLNGDYSAAVEWYEGALRLARETGYAQAEQSAMTALGNAFAALGQGDQAKKLFAQQKARPHGAKAAPLSPGEPPTAGAEPPEAEARPVQAEVRQYEQTAAQQYVTWKSSLEKVDLTTLDPSSETQKESYFTATRMVDRVEIENYKVIEHLELDVNRSETGGAPWMMLLGENGSGKSSVLQAVTLALVGETYRNELPITPQEVLRYGKDSGYVRVHLSGSDQPIELYFDRKSERFTSSPAEPRTLVLAYGSTRLLPKGRAEPLPGKPYAHVDNMFNPFVPLRDATDWILALDDGQFDTVARALKDLLALDEEDAICREMGKHKQVFVCRGAIKDPLSHLSDGYQSVLALSADVLAIMLELWKAPEIAEGLVLIDELGAHLHPRWRMRIVKSLRAAFPRLQFLVSTHDPLCLRGLNEGEVTVMRLKPDRTAETVIDLPPVQGLRVDQLLTSEHFGMNSTIDPDIEALFNEYYKLLAARSLTGEEKKRLEELKSELDKYKLMGQTRRERMMLEVIDEYLAEEPKISSPAERKERESETRRKAKAIWASLK